MPNRYKSNCYTCQLSKKDLSVRKRIRYAAYKREAGDETLQDISIEIGVSSPSIYNHVKRHMEDVSERYQARREVQTAKKVAAVKIQVQEEAELVLEADTVDAIEARPLEIAALDDYIAQAKALIDRKELKITASTFLAATKIRSDWSNKQQSNKTDFMKTIYALASGAKKDKDNGQPKRAAITGTIAGDDHQGEEGSNPLYKSASGA
jgi:hypothetical protein